MTLHLASCESGPCRTPLAIGQSPTPSAVACAGHSGSPDTFPGDRGCPLRGFFIEVVRIDAFELGFAWRYSQYDKPVKFAAAEADARDHRRGLWADPNPVPPWEWRKMKRKGLPRPLNPP